MALYHATSSSLKKIKDTIEHGVYFCPGKTNCLTYTPHNIDLELSALNVSIVGNLTINKGVVSGFNSTSWLVLPNKFSPSSKNWEAVFKFKLTALNKLRHILNCSDLAYQQIELLVTADNKLSAGGYVNNTSNRLFTIVGTTNLQANTDYWGKIAYTSTGYTLYMSIDGETWSTEATTSISTTINQGYNLAIGADFSNNGAYYAEAFTDGSIDISQSYIKINNEIWWKGGTGAVTLKAGSKVYFGDGSSRVIEQDTSQFINDKVSRYIYVHKDSNALIQLAVSSSGTDPVNTTGNEVVFNTSNNKVELYTNGVFVRELSFPVGYNYSNQSVTPFQWCGSIGCTSFVLPNVKGLISNGYNEDKTYKNIEFETDSVLTCTSQGDYTATLVLNASLLDRPSANDVSYDRDTNKVTYQGYPMSYIQLGSVVFKNGKITSMSLVDPQTTNELVPINKINRGSELVYLYKKYLNGVVLFESLIGESSTLNLQEGKYLIILVGGGGGAGATQSNISEGGPGGSGAAIKLIVYLSAGTYTIKGALGGTNGTNGTNGETASFSQNDNVLISATGGGGGGYGTGGLWSGTGAGGSGGTYHISESLPVIEQVLTNNGIAGTNSYHTTRGTPGQSVANLTDYPNAGAGGYTTAGFNGYCYIQLLKTGEDIIYSSTSEGAIVKLTEGVYRVTVVGSGGGNSCWGACNAGGSGAAYEADIYIPEERNITCTVSSGAFGIEGLVVANPGYNGNWANGGDGYGGALNFNNSGNFDIIQTIISTNGNRSTSRLDTVSAYDGTADGYGAAKASSGSVSGIVKITFLRNKRDEDI